ncbi:hypothetical protein [Pleionea sp. CnH1-48]|uniref:hypothetical protein n=1 Tax=Pleionea sp. CnH1-48 TaxID=2954494 RepID=UPI0020983AB7|nr:hypothetical protein [Pleionea sp. CnH1-48]MCO7225929.1 hypothetical protein [Pleionea sp. CnH1-48]
MIKIVKFVGVVPRVDKRLLTDNHAQVAENCRLLSGALEAWNEPKLSATIQSAASTIYRYQDRSWFEWNKTVDVVRSPVNRDIYKRVYWTGDGEPKMTVSNIADNSSAPYPNNSFRLGVPSPLNPPTVELVNPQVDLPAADAAKVEDRFYLYTFVSAYGEEGPPSRPSALIEWNETKDVWLSNLQTSISGDFNIAAIRAYRTNEGQYQFVKEIPFGQATSRDSKLSQDLGELLPSLNWLMPPADLEGLTSMSNGVLAGFRDNQICFSEPFQPHAWPEDYQLSVDFDIVGLGTFGNNLVVLTNGFPYVITGSHPSSFITEKIEVAQACVSKNSIVSMDAGVIYASQDGLVNVSFNGTQCFTKSLFTKEEWSKLNPSSINAAWHDQRYIAFFESNQGNKGLIIDPKDPQALTFVDDFAQALFLDITQDTLYFAQANGNQIYEWNHGENKKQYLWKSKEFVRPYPVAYFFGQVDAQSYPLTLRIYQDGQLAVTKVIKDSKPFRLPVKKATRAWEVEVKGQATINTIYLTETINELQRM